MEFEIKEEITVTMKKEDIEKMIIECLQSYEHVFDGVKVKVKRKEN